MVDTSRGTQLSESPVSRDSFGELRSDPPLIGIQQIGFEGATDEEEIQWRTAQMISRALNTRRVIGFVGSGLSRAYELPDWQQFAKTVMKITLEILNQKGFKVAQVGGLIADYDKPQEEKSPLSETDRTLTVLGACDDAIFEVGAETHKEFRKRVAAIFGDAPPIPPNLSTDPLINVIEKLEIRRFLTTNYDYSIEHAFARAGHCSPEQVEQRKKGQRLLVSSEKSATRVRPIARFLSFGEDDPDALLQFAVGSPGYEMGVFHLHGEASRPDSMIVTEGDYQRLYLKDDARHQAYREALRLAFSANPILFIGVGLTEADLLRPLRQFVSERAGPRPERPLFALYERPKGERAVAQAAEWRQYLYGRFGLKVLYYDSESDDSTLRTKALCQAVIDLASRWRKWWSDWQEKPATRTPKFRKLNKLVMVRHETETDDLFLTEQDNSSLADAVRKSSVVLALGQPGTGKGSLGLRLAKEPHLFGFPNLSDSRRFFATAHFTNDFLSMIRAAADHFSEPSDDDPLERLMHALREESHLFILGGLERLLIPESPDEASLAGTKNGEPVTQHPAIDKQLREYPVARGRPGSVEAEEFLSGLVDLAAWDGKGRVVLTSSVWPTTFDGSKVVLNPLTGVTKESVEKKAFEGFNTDDALIDKLCVAMGKHAYALAVVAKAIKRLEPAEQKEEIERLIARVTAMDLPRRTEKAIELALKTLMRNPRHQNGKNTQVAKERAERLEGVLERVALFSTPVPAKAVTFSYEEADKDLQELKEANLLLGIKGDNVDRYTAHTVVRTYVLQLLGCMPDSPGEAQRFRAAGFATDETEAEPGSIGGYHLISNSVDSLLGNIDKTLRPSPTKKSDEAENRQIIRAAFGLIRSRWTATGVARLGNLSDEDDVRGTVPAYFKYRERLARLLNSVRRADAGNAWVIATKQKTADNGILYADELLWLYNELALSAFCQGSMADAYALFRMAQDIVEVIEGKRPGERWCQSEINLGLVQLERGWLKRARYHLENALRGAEKLPQRDVLNQAIGFLGLLSHLSGDYERAGKQYKIAINNLRKDGNGRALSLLLRHSGDLKRRLGDLKEAELDIEASIAVAESGRYPDLLYCARLAQANIRRKRKDLTAVNMVSSAAEFARKVGLLKLEADAYIVHAQFALAQGDIDLAGRRSAEALAIATALRMGLRVSGALVLAARVAKARGYPSQARRILKAAIQLGVRQGHQLRVEAAEQELIKLPPD